MVDLMSCALEGSWLEGEATRNLRVEIKMLVDRDVITIEQANDLFRLHNDAFKDETYGEKLFYAFSDLCEQGKLDEDEIGKLYLLSVDWPLDRDILYLKPQSQNS